MCLGNQKLLCIQCIFRVGLRPIHKREICTRRASSWDQRIVYAFPSKTSTCKRPNRSGTRKITFCNFLLFIFSPYLPTFSTLFKRNRLARQLLPTVNLPENCGCNWNANVLFIACRQAAANYRRYSLTPADLCSTFNFHENICLFGEMCVCELIPTPVLVSNRGDRLCNWVLCVKCRHHQIALHVYTRATGESCQAVVTHRSCPKDKLAAEITKLWSANLST